MTPHGRRTTAPLRRQLPFSRLCLRTPPTPGVSSDPNIDESKLCRSPVAGIVVRIDIEAGQQLKVDDQMVVLEAMKMETNVTAPIAGKVKVSQCVAHETQ